MKEQRASQQASDAGYGYIEIADTRQLPAAVSTHHTRGIQPTASAPRASASRSDDGIDFSPRGRQTRVRNGWYYQFVFTWLQRIATPITDRFRETVSGSKSGTPDWALEMALGTDEGLFGPESAVWEIHGSLSTLVGGIRALLLQAAHPAALAGVAEHSRYESDPLGRLAGTTRWLTVTTFGSTEVVNREAARVNTIHARVTGRYLNRSGHTHDYAARDTRFLLWVHCAFTDSFLKAHQALGFPLTRGADRYVSEWRRSAELLGLTGSPASAAELERELQRFRDNDLVATETTRRVIRFILHPPFSRGALVFYRVLANAAIATLDENDLRLLGLRKKHRGWLRLAFVGLVALRAMLGDESPSQRLARDRIARLQATSTPS